MTLPQTEWRNNKITPKSVIIIQSYKRKATVIVPN